MPAPDYVAEISALEAALSSGELTVEQDGERVTYKDTADLLKALTYFQGKALAAPKSPAAGAGFGFSSPILTRG